MTCSAFCDLGDLTDVLIRIFLLLMRCAATPCHQMSRLTQRMDSISQFR